MYFGSRNTVINQFLCIGISLYVCAYIRAAQNTENSKKLRLLRPDTNHAKVLHVTRIRICSEEQGVLNLVFLNPLSEIKFSGSQLSDGFTAVETLINTDICELPPEIQI